MLRRAAGASESPAKLNPVLSSRRPRPLRLLAAFSVAAVVLGVPAALAQSLSERKDTIDARISGLRENIEKAKEKEGVLSSEIDAASRKIDSVEAEIEVLTVRLSELERELAAHRERLARLDDLLRERTRLLEKLAREHARAQRQLEERLVELYQTD